MFNPDIELSVARQRHEDMLKDAERQRLYQQLPRSQPNRLEQLGHRINYLVRRFKAQARSKPPMAALGKH